MSLALLGPAILTLTLLSFFSFPGHTILQSDTQIYIPILEHLWDPSMFTQDIMATRPHVSFTLYDEMAMALRRLSGGSFEHVLMAQQFVYRFLGIAGLYFLACALGLAPFKSLLVAAVVSLGATIAGPAVLTVEYEPVPRGFAFPFLLASLAFVGYQRWRGAALCATVAFGFHPPTALAYCGLLLILLLAKRRFADIAVLAIAPTIMLLTLVVSDPPGERQPLLGRIEPDLEALQRLRGSYNWVSIWLANWIKHYAFLAVAVAVALWRVRDHVPKPLRFMLAALPLIGALSVPASFLLIEQAKWVAMTQFQPGRYLLFVTFMAALLCTVAGVIAAERRRWIESIVFLTIAFAIPMDAKVTNVLAPALASAISIKRLGLAIALAVLAAAAAALKPSRIAYAALVGVAFLPFAAIPVIGQVRNYAALNRSDLDDIARWARDNTHRDALFQFADAARDLPPGVFRARAKRAVFADWKAGGQVNFHKRFSELWWSRWQLVEKPQPLEKYRELGIDYVIFKAGAHPGIAAGPVYTNAGYVVYKLK